MTEDERIAALFASPPRGPDEAFVARIDRDGAGRAEVRRVAATRPGAALPSNARRARRSSPPSISSGGWGRPSCRWPSSRSRPPPPPRSSSLPCGSRSSCARRRRAGKSARGSVSRVLSTALRRMGGHSSRRRIAPPLKQPTRATSGNTPICRPYSVLLPVGFAVPPPLPEARWALTPPFHLAATEAAAVLLSVALSLGSPPPGVTRHRRSMEPGLSSPPLARGRGRPTLWPRLYRLCRARGPRAAEQDRAALAVDRCRRAARGGSGAGRRSPPSGASRTS